MLRRYSTWTVKATFWTQCQWASYCLLSAEWIASFLLCSVRGRLPAVCALHRSVPAWDQGKISVSHHAWIPQAQLQRPGQKFAVTDWSSVPAGWSVSFYGLVERLFLFWASVWPDLLQLGVTQPHRHFHVTETHRFTVTALSGMHVLSFLH